MRINGARETSGGEVGDVGKMRGREVGLIMNKKRKWLEKRKRGEGN